MTRWSRIAGGAVSSTSLVATLATCTSEPSSGGNASISDPAVFEAEVRSSFLPMVAGISDGLARLVTALGGGVADGVVVVPNAGGADATISLDLDGDGSRESSINGSLDGDVATGAQVTVAAIATAEPTLAGNGTLLATETSPGMIVLDNIGGSGGSDPSGHRNAADVAVTDGTVTLDVVGGTPDGFLDLDISGEQQTLGVHVSFESDGHGGYLVHFTGNGLDFTIP
ncbi:MAG TPA: hypothetical protein VLT17_00105 [Gemmatimonadales bacterium]|nr:hypothetical protein [Gemmatimonadales bacterium]